MTAPKYRGRRIGFGGDDARTGDDVRAFGRWVYLQVIADEMPDVLVSLGAVPGASAPDPASLASWAARWHLTDDWCLAYAVATWRAWRRWKGPRVWHDGDDGAGWLVADHATPPALRPLRHGDHWRWLVRYQVGGQSCACIAAAAGTSSPVVHEAIRRAADLIGLTRRPALRGRPTRPVS